MKSIFCGGKFKLKEDKSLKLEERIKEDYRAYLLKDPKKFLYSHTGSIILDKYKYNGTFYCEKASNGDYTSTDCNTVLKEEYKALSESDIFLCVFDDTFSVGTVVELNWAVNLNKEIIICFKKKDNSPLNTSINSIKYINQESPSKPVERQNNFKITKNIKLYNDNCNTEINKNKRCNIFDTKKRLRTPRPKSVKNISPNKQNSSKKKIIDYNVKKERKKNCFSSNKRTTTILPYLKDNKQIMMKSKLKNEVSNLFKMLPDNFYEDPEINNQMNLLIHNIAELKQCIYKNNKLPVTNNEN